MNTHLRSILLLALIAPPAFANRDRRVAAHPDTNDAVDVRVDSARREVVATVRGIRIPAGASYTAHFAPAPVQFIWPVSGWART